MIQAFMIKLNLTIRVKHGSFQKKIPGPQQSSRIEVAKGRVVLMSPAEDLQTLPVTNQDAASEGAHSDTARIREQARTLALLAKLGDELASGAEHLDAVVVGIAHDEVASAVDINSCRHKSTVDFAKKIAISIENLREAITYITSNRPAHT